MQEQTWGKERGYHMALNSHKRHQTINPVFCAIP